MLAAMTIHVARDALGSTAPAFGTPDRVEANLENWRRWMRSGGLQGGYGPIAIGLSNGGASQDFDDMAEACDRVRAKVVNTIIEDLPSVEQCALHHAYLHSVFRFREPVDVILARAKRSVGRGLAAKSVW